MTSLLLEIDLGAESSGACLAGGWGGPEGAHRWSIGQTSRIRLRLAQPQRPHVVILDAVPWLHPPEVPAQRIMVGVNDRLVATLSLTGDMVFAVPVPAGAAADGTLEISLLHLDSARSATIDRYRDGSSLGLMVRTARLFAVDPAAAAPVRLPPLPEAAWPPPAARRGLLMQFESLGHRCAFGLLQGRHGAEPLDLLRFAGIHTPTLVRELVRGFAGLGDPAALHAFIRTDACGLWSLYDREREVWFNTSQLIEACPEAEVIASAAHRLPFLRRRFLAGLAGGRRIYVLNSPLPMTEQEALAVFTALNLKASCALLWTNQSGSLPPGTVERLAPGFYYGQLDMAGEIAGDPSDAAWFSICAHARALRTEELKLLPTEI